MCRTLFVFILVLAGWVFFRSQSVKDALYILSHLVSFQGFAASEIWTLGVPRFQMMTAFVLIGGLFCVDYILANGVSVKQYILNRLFDYAVLSGQWLHKDCGLCDDADLNLDHDVDIFDIVRKLAYRHPLNGSGVTRSEYD